MLFTMLPTITTRTPVATISQADIEYLTEYDPSSYEHWIFDKGDAGGLVGRKAGKVLVPQSSVEGQGPSFGSSHVTVLSAIGRGLITDIVETATVEDTICAVVQDPFAGAQLSFLWGNYARDLGGGGAGFTIAAPDRALHGFYAPIANSANSGLKVTAEGWYFVAVSRSFSGSTKRVRMFVGGVGTMDVTGSSTYTSATRPVVIGNGYYVGTSATNGKNYAEFAAYQRSMSTADLQTLYTRAKVRAAARGIAVV